jgi:hypothetical protein
MSNGRKLVPKPQTLKFSLASLSQRILSKVTLGTAISWQALLHLLKGLIVSLTFSWSKRETS